MAARDFAAVMDRNAGFHFTLCLLTQTPRTRYLYVSLIRISYLLMTKSRATQKDVAKAAGVSQATVSMVLSGGGGSIPAETWTRITNAAKELGYVPNRFAQALKTNRSMTIACIVPDITNPFYPSLIRGIQAVADGVSYDVIAVNTDGLPDRERHFLDWARQGRVDGVIGVFFTLRAGDFGPLVEAGVPVVRIEASRKPVAMSLSMTSSSTAMRPHWPRRNI